jgi:tetratricopeptide (TPR) repeat protein
LIARRLIPIAFCVLLGIPGLSGPAVARDINSEPTVVRDPHFGEVLFYFYQEDYFPAIVRLLAARQHEQLANHAEEAELLLGGMYLSYGHHLRAAEIFEELLADNVNPDVRDRTWFFLAKIWLQRGYLEQAEKALANIGDPLPGSMEAERQMLMAQLMIDSGRYDRAISILGDWRDRTEWSSYARFNLAVAMVRGGQVADGAAILDALGQMDPYTEELSSLRDKANLALGYAYLQSQQPLAAKRPLQRVRLEGPFSNKALLGVGWADAEIEDYSRAIVPWMELKDRSLLDPAVQESMLAIPYAMAKLDSISQAADYYLNAIEAFYEESGRIDTMIELLESGAVFDQLLAQDAGGTTGWYWKLDELPEGPESRYLFHLASTHEFQEGLKNYRDLVYLARNLDDWEGSIDVYRNMLETRELAYERRLPRIEANLAAADVDEMIARKLDLDARLNNIESNGDFVALASKRESELWDEITSLEQSRAANTPIPEAEAVRDKIRLLKGVLQWDLERDFKSRLAKLKREVRETGEALVETQRARRKVDESMREEPELFAAFGQRVGGLSPRIDSTRARVYDAMHRQRTFLQSIAVDELRAQKKRLGVYTVQARFALAAIYDLSATTVGATAE